MARPWHEIDRVQTPSGLLELRRRGAPEAGDFLILIDGRILMSSRAQRSEQALAERATARLSGRPDSRLLIGGLGMGITLRTALDHLRDDARVDVAELEPAILRWCRGALAPLTNAAADDPRVHVRVSDVADVIAAGARDPERRWDAIALDLFEGPHPGTAPESDPLYGTRALRRTREALRPTGVLAVWSETRDRAFERRLEREGFRVDVTRPGHGGLRHAVVLAERGD